MQSDAIPVPISRVLGVLAVDIRRVAGDRAASRKLAADVMKIANAIRVQSEKS